MLKNEKLFYFVCLIVYFCSFLFFSYDPFSEKTNNFRNPANEAAEISGRYSRENFAGYVIVSILVIAVLMFLAGAYHFLKSKKKSLNLKFLKTKKRPESKNEKRFRVKKRRFI